MFIQDSGTLDPDFFPIPVPGSRGQKAPDPDPQHWSSWSSIQYIRMVGIFVDLCVLLGKRPAELGLEDVRDEAQHKLVSPNLASEPAFRVQDAEIDIVEIVSHAASTRRLRV
jgi:hypothetical protein